MHKVYIVVISWIILTIGITLYSFTIKPSDISNKIQLYKMNITNVEITDQFGSNIRTIKANDLILIHLDIVNLHNATKGLVIVKSKYNGNITYDISFNMIELEANEKIRIATSLIPKESGEYFIDIFVWNNIDGTEVLAPRRSIKISVMK